MEPGSKERILATVKKNFGRPVSLGSFLKVMGMSLQDRTTMLEKLGDTGLHVWLLNVGNQDVILISESDDPEMTEIGYKWQ